MTALLHWPRPPRPEIGARLVDSTGRYVIAWGAALAPLAWWARYATLDEVRDLGHYPDPNEAMLACERFASFRTGWPEALPAGHDLPTKWATPLVTPAELKAKRRLIEELSGP